MRNLSDLFEGKVKAEVDPENSRLDDEILSEYMNQEWRQAFLANESYLNPAPPSTSVCMFGDGPASRDRRPRKKKASEGLFGRVHRFVRTSDIDFRRCHGDASRDGTITLSSKRRAVNADHCYYVSPTMVPAVPEQSREERQLAVRQARKSVRRAIRKANSRERTVKYIRLEDC